MIRILLVEDEPAAAEYLHSIIAQHLPDMQVMGQAENGAMALDLLKHQPCDIVVTDIAMPVLDGLGLAKAIHEAWPWMRCVLVSGYQDFQYAQEAIRYGVSDYLVKPVSAKDLVDRLVHLSLRIEYVRRINELVLYDGRRLTQTDLLALEHEIGQTIDGYSDLIALKEKLDQQVCELAGRFGNGRASDPHCESFLRITSYIQEHLHQPLSIRTVARACGHSEKSINRLMKKYAQCSFVQYLTTARIDRAKSLLMHAPQMLLKDVAEQVGYSDPLYFSRVFRRVTGLSPSTYANRRTFDQ